MMISVDNYFDYRNAKLMTASFGAGYTADSMDYPALVCNDVEAPATVSYTHLTLPTKA